MAEPHRPRYVGKEIVVENGSVVLGPEDREFSISLYGLTFTIQISTSRTLLGSAAPIDAVKVTSEKMLVTVSTLYSQNVISKIQSRNAVRN
jgi:hypothetical protein